MLVDVVCILRMEKRIMDEKTIIFNTLFLMCLLCSVIDLIAISDDDFDFAPLPSFILNVATTILILMYWALSAI